MKTIEQKFEEKQKRELPDIQVGDRVKVWHVVGRDKDGEEKVSPFIGVVIARKHGSEPGATITVRGEVQKVAVEKIFPLHSPVIKEVEVLTRHKVRRSKLYYLRERRGKKARLRRKE